MTLKHPDFGILPPSWSVLTLGDVADVTKLAGFEFTKHIEYLEDGEIIALRSLNVCDGQLDLSKIKRISKGASDALPRSKLFVGDLLLTYTGSKLGDTAMIDSNDRYHLAPNVCRLRAHSDEDAYYLYLFMRSAAFSRILDNFKVGSGQPTVPMKNIRKIPIPWPNEAERSLICRIYKSLNNKAVTNVKVNQTLEEMAQAIFKSWFVDFDPVKAKMNGEQPEGMDEVTASLFPEKLVESELGMIPEGWEIKPIKDLCSKVQNGGTPKRSESSYWDDGDIPWLTSGEVRQSIITSVENRITQLGLDKSSAKWVPGLSTLVALYGATAGEVSLTSIPLTTNQAVCALMPKKEHQWYNYLQLKSRVAELAGKAVGSAQQNISKGLVESTEVLSVPESLLEAFNAQVENLFKLRICNLQENVELAKLRDTLLPKLLSGEIELGNAEASLND